MYKVIRKLTRFDTFIHKKNNDKEHFASETILSTFVQFSSTLDEVEHLQSETDVKSKGIFVSVIGYYSIIK